MIIDSHHHFWNYDPVNFAWLDDDMASIRRSFLPGDLQKTIAGTGVEGVVSVQARQMVEETDWLLKLAHENKFIKGVVGWVPLGSEEIYSLLEKYATNPWLKGVRHVVQDEPDPEFILGEKFNRGISLLKDFQLVYDILIFEHQLPNTIRFVDRHPGQLFVLDHIAKPKIKMNEIENWSKNIKELAKRKNVSCKISGMVTEADYKNWIPEELQPYFNMVLEAFGPSRLLFGSDWPVCLVATEYQAWLLLMQKVFAGLSSEEQNQIFYQNAVRIYQL